MTYKHTNKLINEKSPYLLQHAHNPVNWYPWSDEAFEKAKQEDKPIFLSIGYSTCHWCHVMEHESFEDEEVAELMNDVFVSIKVDREERPDIDNIYMTICQMMTGGGGWPLSVVLTPDRQPFFSGTYFPKESLYGRIGFKDLILNINDAWKNKRSDVDESADKITAFFKDNIKSQPGESITEPTLDKAYEYFSDEFDEEFGGFGNAPKFPSPHNLLFLLSYHNRASSHSALQMVEKTLMQMRLGGVWDHVGYGFHRYSTDREWLVPHFEKMLYDQSMLLYAYTEAYKVTGNESFKDTALNTCEYVIRDMTSDEGAFYSAEDADSEGVEGKFYVWSTEELKEILTEEEYELTKNIYNIKDDGNFLEESTRSLTGDNILHLTKPLELLADDSNHTVDSLNIKLDSIRDKLFNYREKRIHPYKDDKVLTDWNGLMISAITKAGVTFNNNELIEAAIHSYAFVQRELVINGKLYHRYRDCDASIDAHLDDYAFLINGVLELYNATFDTQYLKDAIVYLDESLNQFWDDQSGGFFFTSTKTKNLIARTKEDYDAAIPSGNSVMLHNLISLYRLTARAIYNEKADELIKAFSPKIKKTPQAYTHFLYGVSKLFEDSKEIVIVGDAIDAERDEVITEIRRNKIDVTVLLIRADDKKRLIELAPFIDDYKQLENKTTYYVCKNFACNQPTTDPQKALQFLA